MRVLDKSGRTTHFDDCPCVEGYPQLACDCDICHVCGERYADCKMPLFHNQPTINSIELPARIRAIGNKTPDQYTATDIAALNDYTT